MPVYVNFEHGLTLGKGPFSFRNDDGSLENFGAIVWARRYDFDQFSAENVRIRTPAQQVLWMTSGETSTVVHAPGEGPGGFGGPAEFNPVVPTPFIENWLVANTPRHGFAKPAFDERNPSIFFGSPADGRKLVSLVYRILDGVRIQGAAG
jgi:hypothetical protein